MFSSRTPIKTYTICSSASPPVAHGLTRTCRPSTAARTQLRGVHWLDFPTALAYTSFTLVCTSRPSTYTGFTFLPAAHGTTRTCRSQVAPQPQDQGVAWLHSSTAPANTFFIVGLKGRLRIRMCTSCTLALVPPNGTA